MDTVIVKRGTAKGVVLIASANFAYGDTVLNEHPILHASLHTLSAHDVEACTSAAALASLGGRSGELYAALALQWLRSPDSRRRAALGLDHSPATKLGEAFSARCKVAGAFLARYTGRSDVLGVADAAARVMVVAAMNAFGNELGSECGLFEVGCRASHACRPNCHWRITRRGTLLLRATRDIRAGEELTVTYLGPDLLWSHRHRVRTLRDTKFFVCACSLCSAERHANVDMSRAMRCPRCECGVAFPAVHNTPADVAHAAAAAAIAPTLHIVPWVCRFCSHSLTGVEWRACQQHEQVVQRLCDEWDAAMESGSLDQCARSRVDAMQDALWGAWRLLFGPEPGLLRAPHNTSHGTWCSPAPPHYLALRLLGMVQSALRITCPEQPGPLSTASTGGDAGVAVTHRATMSVAVGLLRVEWLHAAWSCEQWLASCGTGNDAPRLFSSTLHVWAVEDVVDDMLRLQRATGVAQCSSVWQAGLCHAYRIAHEPSLVAAMLQLIDNDWGARQSQDPPTTLRHACAQLLCSAASALEMLVVDSTTTTDHLPRAGGSGESEGAADGSIDHVARALRQKALVASASSSR